DPAPRLRDGLAGTVDAALQARALQVELEVERALGDGHHLAERLLVHPRGLHRAQEVLEAGLLEKAGLVRDRVARGVAGVVREEEPGAGLARLGRERDLVALR